MPPAARIGLKGVTPWQTANGDFYRIDTAIVVPAIEPKDWSLRIHGKVDREITLTYCRPGRPRVHRGLGHPLLRLQRRSAAT